MTSIIKVNNLQNQCGANTINKCGTAITVGASGDTVTLAAGASQSGFGQTYSAVSWDTTPKTTTVTGVAGVGYFVNTSGGAVTVNLPAGVAGDIVAINDYANTAATNNITISANGTEKIQGDTSNKLLNINGTSTTLVYTDSTQGWKVVDTGEISSVPSDPVFITATGGTITTVDTDYKVHTFTGPGTFTVCSVGNPFGSDSVDYMVVAGGGAGGGGEGTGGGGAGGFREGYNPGSYTASPLATSSLTVTATSFPIVVGGGGAVPSGCSVRGNQGGVSSFSSIISTGGGGGGSGGGSPTQPGGNGGSGGGAGGRQDSAGGSGNTPPVSPPQGQPGGRSTPGSSPPTIDSGGGGGGAGGVGTTGINSGQGGPGGAGVTTLINGSSVIRAGGGGAGSESGAEGAGGPGGGGDAGDAGGAVAGTTNTGGGGGGNGSSTPIIGAAGGSGIVIIRYKFQ